MGEVREIYKGLHRSNRLLYCKRYRDMMHSNTASSAYARMLVMLIMENAHYKIRLGRYAEARNVLASSRQYHRQCKAMGWRLP